jgi:parallel beta-helix repeat protein
MSMNRRTLLSGIALASGSLAPRRFVLASSSSRSFYVSSSSGSDFNAGTIQSPFKSIGHVFRAITDLGPNDSVVVMPGVYSEQVVVSKGGDAQGYLTLKSVVPHAAKIRSPKSTYSALNIIKSYVVVEGFDVQAGGNGHGIEATFIDGNTASNGPHHINIINNVSHQNAGSGIGVAYGDFYRIEDNLCYGNCATNPYQGSGISIYAARAVAGPDEPFRNFVRRNVCFDNMVVDLPGFPEPPHSDGNGIIIDDLINSQSHHPAGVYPFRTLVENNVCYRNGGRGVHVFLSNRVTVRNNTAYHNNHDKKNPGTWRGELSNVCSSDTIWANNIGVADLATNRRNTAINEGSTARLKSERVQWFNNLTFDGRSGSPSVAVDHPNSTLVARPNQNLLGTDPQFVGLEVKSASDLMLRPGSPAVDAGTSAFGVSECDASAGPRHLGNAVDLGAFELAVKQE